MRPAVILLFACLLAAADGAVRVGPNPTAARFFTERIQPVLEKHCYACHAGKKRYGGLQVDSLAALLAGGFDEGPAVIPGDTVSSSLLRSIRHEGDSDLNMPPNAKLPEAVIRDFERWVDIGAPWPDAAAKTVVAGAAPPRPPFLGRLHPVAVHLPIAALLLAVLAELLVWWRGERWKPATALLVVTGALGAALAIASGLGLEGAQDARSLALHERLGWLTGTGALLAAALLVAMRWRPLPRWILLAVLVATAGLAMWTGHAGGTMVWGDGWLAP